MSSYNQTFAYCGLYNTTNQVGNNDIPNDYTFQQQISAAGDASFLNFTPYLADGSVNLLGGVQVNGILNTIGATNMTGELTIENDIQLNPKAGGASSSLLIANGNVNITAGNVALTGGHVQASAGISSFSSQTPIIFQAGSSTNTVALPIIAAGGFCDYYVGSAQSANVPFPNSFPTNGTFVSCAPSGFPGDPGILFVIRSITTTYFDGYFINTSSAATLAQPAGTITFNWLAWGN